MLHWVLDSMMKILCVQTKALGNSHSSCDLYFQTWPGFTISFTWVHVIMKLLCWILKVGHCDLSFDLHYRKYLQYKSLTLFCICLPNCGWVQASRLFLFQNRALSEGLGYAGKQLGSKKKNLSCKNGRKSTKKIKSPEIFGQIHPLWYLS